MNKVEFETIGHAVDELYNTLNSGYIRKVFDRNNDDINHFHLPSKCFAQFQKLHHKVATLRDALGNFDVLGLEEHIDE